MKRLAWPWLFSVMLTISVLPCTSWSFDPVQTTSDLAPNEPPLEASSGTRPLYEAGLGIGAVYGSDYPGSDHSQLWLALRQPIIFLELSDAAMMFAAF